MSRLRLRAGVAAAPPDPPGDTLTSGPGPIAGASYDYNFPPLLYVRPVTRTPLVDQGDEFIDLQTEFAHPGSPTVTTWTVGGADVGYFDLTGGRLTFKASTRASIPRGAYLNLTVTAENAYGTDGPYAYQVWVPADANCRFLSLVSGSDAANGLTPATAKKYMPGATGYTGSAVTYGADICVFFKAERHRYRLASGVSSLSHAGTSGHHMRYVLNGWGGRATISGDDDITGWTAASSGDVGNNPNVANIEKIDLTAGSNGGAIEWYSHLYFGDVMGFPAQAPTPADLWNFEDPNDVTEQGGMYRAQVTTSTGVTPRINQPGGASTTVTIVDARASAMFGANNPTGWPCNIWTTGNNVTRGTVASYDQATSTFTVTLTGTINDNAGYCAYSFSHHPCLIVEAGQFGLTTAKTTATAWRPNAGVTSVNRRDRGLANDQSYTMVEGGLWERFLGSESSAGSSVIVLTSAAITDQIYRNMIVRQCRADSGDACAIQGNNGGSSNAFANPIIEGIAVLDRNPRAAAFKFGCTITGYFDGTEAQVRANDKGYIDGNYFAEYSHGRSTVYLTRGNGVRISRNIIRRIETVHGNIFPIYSDAADAYDEHHLIENNFVEEAIRALTVSIHSSLLTRPRYNYYKRNVFLGKDTGFVVALYAGDPGSVIEQNIIMGAQGWDYSAGAVSIGVGSGVTVRDNVIAGMSIGSPQSSCTYTVTDNLFTVNQIAPNDGPTRVSTGNTVATGAPFKEWDGVITSEMAAVLGPGQIGVFWNIPA